MNTKYLLFLMVLTPFFAIAQESNEKTIKNILEKQVKEWNSGNIAGFMEAYWNSDSLVFIGKNGISYGWENTLNRYIKSYPDTKTMGTLEFIILIQEKLGKEHFLVTGNWKISGSNNLNGIFTIILKNINNNWKIIYDHSS